MNNNIYTDEEVKLKSTIRKLFTDHIVWTRMYIVDLLENLSSLDNTTDRLIKNNDAIGGYIGQFFGYDIADRLTSLLRGHTILVINLLNAVQNEDEDEIRTIEENIAVNTDNIATFFNTISQHLSKDELVDMLNTYVTLTKYEFIARMDKDYDIDILYHDMLIHHILMLSDYLTQGIIEKSAKEQTQADTNRYEQIQTDDYVLEIT